MVLQWTGEEQILASGKRKVTKYRRPININIGMIVFFMILFYIIVCIINYAINPKVSVYEVKQGSIATSYNYKGFILRNETVVKANDAGYVNFYAREGEKIGLGQVVYTVDETGKLAQLLSDTTNSENTLSENDLKSLKNEIMAFQNNFSSTDFESTYKFKNNLQNTVLELVNLNLLNSIGTSGDATQLDSLKKCTAPSEGIVVYSTDGYEEITQESLTADIMNPENYKKETINSSEVINAGDTVYKLITDENWSVIVPLDEKMVKVLADRTVIKIKFLKDNVYAKAKFSIIQIDGQNYGRLDFNNSCIRYATDRFIDIEFDINISKGLKIPVSSVIEKDFYTIPKEYSVLGGDNSSVSFILETYDDNGKAQQVVVTPVIYYSTDEDYYVDKSEFDVGSYIIKQDSSDRYTISKTASLTGVYNINKGYAVFKQVNILNENEEYYIIEEGTNYGLTVYDHICADGRAIGEDDIITN